MYVYGKWRVDAQKVVSSMIWALIGSWYSGRGWRGIRSGDDHIGKGVMKVEGRYYEKVWNSASDQSCVDDGACSIVVMHNYRVEGVASSSFLVISSYQPPHPHHLLKGYSSIIAIISSSEDNPAGSRSRDIVRHPPTGFNSGIGIWNIIWLWNKSGGRWVIVVSSGAKVSRSGDGGSCKVGNLHI
ncbi:hypothetical protein Tco_0008142 [Tanacetum coccineum]